MAKKKKTTKVKKRIMIQCALDEEVFMKAKFALVSRRESWQDCLTQLIKTEFRIK